MRKAGGIIALIAGIFGVLAAITTLFVGGVAGALSADGASTVVGLGFGGLAFSFLTIVLGAVCLGTTSRGPAIFLIVSSLGGAVLGGTIVAVCMVLAFIGGVLAMIGADKSAASFEPRAKRTRGGIVNDDEGVSNADDLIARQLAINTRAREASQAAASPDDPRIPFGKRRAV